MAWLIRHRYVVLAFILGVFEILKRTLLSNPGVKTPQDFSRLMQPHSIERAEFWGSVVSYAIEFMDLPTNASVVSDLMAAAERNREELNKPSQSNIRFSVLNSKLRIMLASLVAKDIWEFFDTIKQSEGLYRGEVICLLPALMIIDQQ